MKNGEVPRRHNLRCSDQLDALVGIRSKKEKTIQKVELSEQAQLIERPTTRHGRHGYGQETIAATNTDSFLLSLKPEYANTYLPKSGGTVEHWLRDEDEEGSDDQKEKEEESNSVSLNNSNDTGGTNSKSRIKIHKSETVFEKCENDPKAILQKKTPLRAVRTEESEECFQHLISSSNEGKNSNQLITTVKEKNQYSGAVPNSLTIKKTEAAERQISQEDIRDTLRIRSIFTNSENEMDSKLRKPDEKHLKTTTLSESSSSGKVAYEEWLREKLNIERERRRKQKEKEEEERKAREERKKEAERNYEIWKQRSDEAIRERRRIEKAKAEALAKEKMEEMKKKKDEAIKMFQAWKNDRMQKLSKERKERIKNMEIDELKKRREMEIRNNEAQKAFNAWCKESKIRNKEAQSKLLKLMKMEEMQNKNTKEYKEALAREAYDVWLQMKENERHFNESLQGRIMRFDETFRRSHLVPWVPPSNIIPRQFVPTRSRRHQSVKRPIKSNQMYKNFPSSINRSKSAVR